MQALDNSAIFMFHENLASYDINWAGNCIQMIQVVIYLDGNWILIWNEKTDTW